MLRQGRAVSGRDLAVDLGWPQSKVSKIETGKQTADDSDVIEWCFELDASELSAELLVELQDLRVQQFEWRRQLRAGHKDKQQQLDHRQQRAKRIRAVDIAAVTGLVQTADYARRVFTTQASLLKLPDDVNSAVKARLQRQQVLYDSDKQIEILVGESALAYPIATPEEMVVQIDRLISLIGLPHVRFGILPLHRRLPHILPHGYWIVDDVVAIENVTSEHEIDDPDQVEIYHRLTDRMWEVAAEAEEARELLFRIRKSPSLST
jgi:hypothetical protein